LKGGYGRIASNIDLMIMIAKFVNFGVLTEISESIEERLSAPDAPGEAGKDHDNIRVYQRTEIFDLTI
jgi:hypothetical protein